MNEDDLKGLDLESDKLSDLQTDEPTNRAQPSARSGESGTATSTSDESNYDFSDKSSYGRSLLGSDLQKIENTGYAREDDAGSSAVDDSILADDLMHLDSMPGHSVPQSQTFKLLSVGQPSTFMNDRPRIRPDDERLRGDGNNFPNRNTTTSSASSKRNVIAHSLTGSITKAKPSPQGSSNETCQGSQVRVTNRHRRTASEPKIAGRMPRSSAEPLVFNKVELNKPGEGCSSQLTNMLYKKRAKPQTPYHILVLFLGTRLQLLNRRLYTHTSKIQENSKKPFILNVRKSASVFEVIGFLLYQYQTKKNLRPTSTALTQGS